LRHVALGIDLARSMLIFDRAIFLHVPKTGGTWVKAAAANAGLRFEEHLVDGDIHGDLSYCPFPDRFIFAFVREPLSLYKAYWRFKLKQGWDERSPFDKDCKAPTFAAFVENVLRREPAWCTRMFEGYVGPPEREIDFVGRYESLADDLVEALRLSGAAFDEQALRATAPVNVSGVPHALSACSAELADRVQLSEHRAIRRFGYDEG
jgi:hypothetical protein